MPVDHGPYDMDHMIWIICIVYDSIKRETIFLWKTTFKSRIWNRPQLFNYLKRIYPPSQDVY